MEPEPSIDFFCALCGSSLAVSRALQGNVVQCPACSRAIPVPGRLNRHAPTAEYFPLFSPDILSVEMTFVCPGCRRSLGADARYEGAPFSCPACARAGTVPTWSGFVASDLVAKPQTPAVILTAEELEFLIGENEEGTTVVISSR